MSDEPSVEPSQNPVVDEDLAEIVNPVADTDAEEALALLEKQPNAEISVAFEEKKKEDSDEIVAQPSSSPEPHIEEPDDIPPTVTEDENAHVEESVTSPKSHIDVTVQVQDETSNETTTKTIQIEIVQPEQKKPWLGGFQSQTNGIEYHNASSQTYVRTRPPDNKVKYHREQQTKATSSGTTNDQMTIAESSTQMTATGVFVSSEEDTVLLPRPYITAAEVETKRLAAVIVLQSYVRRMRAIAYTKVLREKKAIYDAWVISEQERKIREEEAEWQSRLDRRTNPRTKDDFQLLYHGLEVWRQEQLQTLDGLEGEARTESLVALLKQQCQYLNAIDKLKINADGTNRDLRIKSFFDKAAAPKEWVEEMYNKVNSLETPDTLRARELREVYYALNLQGLEMDERLDILLHVKLTVQEYNSKLTKEIADLLNREADLLTRGADEANLKGLRKRIMNLFLRFCEDPQYNPIAANYLSEHRDKEAFAQGMFVDVGSATYNSSKSFTLRSPGKQPTQNAKGVKNQNIAMARTDITQHKRIMEDIRRHEIAKGYTSQVVFLMSVEDVTYIIETIWGSQSCLSQEAEIFRLTLARWDESKEWSPWNCVLLTKDEAETHEELHKLDTSLQEMYGVALCRAVTQKHLRARCYFLSLLDAQAKGVMKGHTANDTMVMLDTTTATTTTNIEAITSS